MDSIWLGGSDVVTEGTFIWKTSGRKVSDGYSNWFGNQPDDAKGNEVTLGLFINDVTLFEVERVCDDTTAQCSTENREGQL